MLNAWRDTKYLDVYGNGLGANTAEISIKPAQINPTQETSKIPVITVTGQPNDWELMSPAELEGPL